MTHLIPFDGLLDGEGQPLIGAALMPARRGSARPPAAAASCILRRMAFSSRSPGETAKRIKVIEAG
ncbi:MULTISPECIES: hypothetical protein [Paracoccus]|uniref:hypothetical protein n=1 Tax=Paracoccus TaxID=265 RepID=UPI00112A2074|nr:MULTISPECIES: hypothetical protein [Paracoccus]WGR57456.1 hypothetical protein E3U25_15815 [Paracoccus versutus]